MSSNTPTTYEELGPEEAAQIDAVCDRFERAWKETQAGGPVPSLTHYQGQASEQDVLLQELAALDQACRQRYGDAGLQTPRQLGAEPEPALASVTNSLRQSTDVSERRHAHWPSIPGLELVDVLGSGGMGVVYKGRQATLNREVAVKLLRDDHRADPARRQRFLQEAQAVNINRRGDAPGGRLLGGHVTGRAQYVIALRQVAAGQDLGQAKVSDLGLLSSGL